MDLDPTLWGWAAAVAAGSAFMWLLRWVLKHLDSDLTYARRSGRRGADVAEAAVDELEKRS